MFPRQVFGLAGSAYSSDFPGKSPSVVSTFAPAYRCGAAPDFHRIPFSLSIRRDRGMG
jgi:hypothetical protein